MREHSSAKYLALLDERVTPQEALAWGLVNFVVSREQLDSALDDILQKSFHASRTAVAESKRLLQQSFHRDPRTMIEDLVAAEMTCHQSWELHKANEAWQRREEVRFFPR